MQVIGSPPPRAAGGPVRRALRIVIDTGGTFTDVVTIDETTGKSSRPRYRRRHKPSVGVAILIAVSARARPAGVAVASALVAALMVGADSLQRSLKLPRERLVRLPGHRRPLRALRQAAGRPEASVIRRCA